jgi:hypothetical protein
LYLHGKNGGEILIGYTFRVGYTYRADCKFINLDINFYRTSMAEKPRQQICDDVFNAGQPVPVQLTQPWQ